MPIRSASVFAYLQKLEWQQEQTTGSPPLGMRGCGFAVMGKRVVIYGGYCGHGGCWHNSLHELDTTTLQWKELAPSDAEGAPMKKSDCNMVAYISGGKEKLCVFGGFGNLKSAIHQPSAIYTPLTNQQSFGYTNELHCFESGVPHVLIT